MNGFLVLAADGSDVNIPTTPETIAVYDDQLAFSKMFKKKYGLSPEQYRKKHDDEHTAQ
jgi:methylphosphotriester-DNA--protein-cysteine methyltransferase